MTKTLKSRLSRAAQYAICLLALCWLAFTTDWAQLRQVLASANWSLVWWALAVFGPTCILISMRLKLLLTIQNVAFSFWQTLWVTFAGNFIIFALPLGAPGGDTVKAFYIARDTPHKHEAVTAVFFDRLIGVVGLLLMSGVVVLLDWDNPAFVVWGRVVVCMILISAAVTAVYFSRRLRRWLRFEQMVAALPMAAHLQRIDRAVFLFRQHLGRVLACFLLTALLQGTCVITYFFAGWALGLDGGKGWGAFPIYLAYTPISLLTGALPIGVMEVTFRQLFSDAAQLGPPEAAVSLSVLGRLIQFVWALPGILVVLRARPRLAELDNEEEAGASMAP